ncbi:mitochondrial ribosomal protein subunit L3 [Schizosaccharomyces osmophilus]|uniref:Large ribosomal subunit protein uL3m n=1 Tax=Schizosaccharomyces osmophilus TaxID=2545709 RepID=A0AAE9WE51_9SCHI|nr:mitochondrial ribosomal protein subunit L3 [Schizosaccharomyces osmophilus]WBW73557.1 mitochondrial ribosomal protein subunit L3 [Schizosaccharomyces osmophilus]
MNLASIFHRSCLSFRPIHLRGYAQSATAIPKRIIQDSPEAAHARRHLLPRTGVILLKKGMTSAWDNETGKWIPLTILQFDRVQAMASRTKEKHGYYAVQMGAGIRKPHALTKADQGQFFASGVFPKMHIKEFQVRDESGLIPSGTELNADYFQPKQYVDIKGVTKGKGFAGVMKRWGFAGGNASHGASLSHRTAGSTGQNTTPGRVLPGRKMAGHMGHKSSTIEHILVWDVDPDLNCILVRGAVPGPNKSPVYVYDTRKR